MAERFYAMNASKRIFFLIFMMIVVVSATACGKLTSEKKVVHTNKDLPESPLKGAKADKDLPEFSLKDPDGNAFSKKDILENGAIFVVTAPILSAKNDQEAWAKYLKATKEKGKGRLIFLEDMSPSSFKGQALSEMKKRSDPDIDPLLLIDPKGTLRAKLGVEKEDTRVLVYDTKGKQVHEERGEASRERAAQVWKSLEK
jgi:hypothetical protein